MSEAAGRQEKSGKESSRRGSADRKHPSAGRKRQPARPEAQADSSGSSGQRARPSGEASSAEDAEALFRTARKLMARHDYAQAAEVLEDIPPQHCTPAVNELLEKAHALDEEVQLLLAEIEHAERVARYSRDLIPTLKRLLELKPGHERARHLLQWIEAGKKGLPDGTPLADRAVRGDEPRDESEGLPWPAIAACIAVAVVAFGLVTIAVRNYLADDDEKPHMRAPQGGVGAAPLAPRNAQVNPPVEANDDQPDNPATDADRDAVQRQANADDGTPLVRLTSLNTPGHEYTSWVSLDGRRIYWTRQQERHEIWMAERDGPGTPFANARKLLDGLHPTLSSDEREIVFVRYGAEGGGVRLFSAVRPSRNEPFGEPTQFLELAVPVWHAQPFLSPDALTLVFRRAVNRGQLPLTFATRAKRDAPWQSPRPLPVSLKPGMGPDLRWPSITPDGLAIFCAHGSPHTPEIVMGTRESLDEPFANFRAVTIQGEPLVGDMPHYVAETDELYFAVFSLEGDGPKHWDLWMVGDFTKHSAASAPDRYRAPLASVPLIQANLTTDAGKRPNFLGFRSRDWLAAHPPSDGQSFYEFNLDSRYDTFLATARLGTGEQVRSDTPLTFQISGDGEVLWESPPVRRSSEHVHCQVDVRGVDVLRLSVRCPGDNGFAQAYWHRPRLIRKIPDSAAGRERLDDWLAVLPPQQKKTGPWEIVFWGPRELSMHPPKLGDARVSFRLNGDYERFVSRVAVTRDPKTPVTFQVHGDGRLLWKSRPLTGRGERDACDVAVNGVELLELRTICAGDQFGAHAIWRWPVLLRSTVDEIDFTFDDRSAGWYAAHSVAPVVVEGGTMTSEITADDPYLVHPALDVAPDRYSEIVVRMKVPGGKKAQLLWQTDENPYFDGSRHIAFPLAGDDEFHEYTIKVGDHAEWRGKRIRALRIDPDATGKPFGRIAEIDFIRGQ